MGLGYEIPRKGICLPGIPFVWNTNLSDDGIIELHPLLAAKMTKSTASTSPTSILFSAQNVLFNEMIPFRDGWCHCLAVGDEVWAVFKTPAEWDLVAARQEELKELREEQASDAAIEIERVRAEERYLVSKEERAIEHEDFDEVLRLLCQRAELINTVGQRGAYSHFMVNVVYERLLRIPLRQGAEFLHRRGADYQRFTELAWFKNDRTKTSDSDFEILFAKAIDLYPANGNLFADIVLMWKRRGRLDFAQQWCQMAISRGLKDYTKSGFEGRLRRLQKLAGMSG